jgi:hypothetical protein
MRTSRVWFALAIVVAIAGFFWVRHTTTDLGYIPACGSKTVPNLNDLETDCDVAARHVYDSHQHTALWEIGGVAGVVILMVVAGRNEQKKEEREAARERG